MPDREAASPKSATKNPTPISSNLQLLLVPLHGLRIAHIEDRIVRRWVAGGGQDDVTLLDDRPVQRVFRVEVWQLPQTEAETLLLEVGDHLRGVRKAGFGELEVAAVRHLEPSDV